MSYINYRIENLRTWLNTKGSYESGLMLFIQYSTDCTATIKSLTELPNHEKLTASIKWLLSELQNTNVSDAEESEQQEEPTQKKKPDDSKIIAKIHALEEKFIFAQRELSKFHALLKRMKTPAQRLAIIKASIIPTDNKARELFSRLESLRETGIDPGAKKQNKILPPSDAAIMKRFYQLPGLISSTRQNLKKTQAALLADNLTEKERERLLNLMAKQNANLELHIAEKEKLKLIVHGKG